MTPPRRLVRVPKVGRLLTPVGDEFVSVEALGGLVVVLAAGLALIWANVDPSSYTQLWGHELTLGVGDAALSLDLQHWLNDGLMALFFFVVGLEIKRELVQGDLRDPRAALVPLVAALGGMVVPAAIFTAWNAGTAAADGWAIPMATDVAIAIGVLALLGGLVDPRLKLFLLSVAIVDDVGAIIVLALFYAGSIDVWWLLGAALTTLAVVGLNRSGVAAPVAYVVPALVLWVCVHESGVHATIAGVVLGLLTPIASRRGRGVLARLEHRLHPVSGFLVVPLFALANSGIVLRGDSLGGAVTGSLGLGIVLGLVVGKPLGILGATVLVTRLGPGRLPRGLALGEVAAAGMVAGIGFTVSLFVADLSYSGSVLDEAKLAVLGASAVAAVLGALALATVGRDRTNRPGSAPAPPTIG